MRAYDLLERMMPAPVIAPPKPAVRPGVRPGQPVKPGPSRPWRPAPRPGVMPRPKAEDDRHGSKFHGPQPPHRRSPAERELTIEDLIG